MKKAYNETWIEHMHIQSTASEWVSKNLLTKEQEAEVKEVFEEKFYRPGIFVKIGLFFFAVIACSFFVGFVSLFFYDTGSEVGFSLLSLICCACFTFFLEHLIKTNKLFHSGIDNALLYSAVTAAMVPVFLLFENADTWFYCLLGLAVLVPVILRYADLLAAIVAFGLLFLFMSSLMVKFPLGKAMLPFGIMALSAAVYFFARKIRSIYYMACRNILEVLALVTFYLGGNYLVVREGNAMMNDLSAAIAPQISFAPLFYFFTLAIPACYIVAGLKKGNRIVLVIGLLAFAFSVHTYFNYFSPVTGSQLLAGGGTLMIILAVALIRYLHTPKHGISDEQEGKRKFADLEAILIAQKLGQTPAESRLEFGGGEFGGGGAGEVY
jgi:hypothetical protein